MLVRLTRKLADRINGIDLSRHSPGDVIDLPDRQANLLIAEGWAEPVAANACAPDVAAGDKSPGR